MCVAASWTQDLENVQLSCEGGGLNDAMLQSEGHSRSKLILEASAASTYTESRHSHLTTNVFKTHS